MPRFNPGGSGGGGAIDPSVDGSESDTSSSSGDTSRDADEEAVDQLKRQRSTTPSGGGGGGGSDYDDSAQADQDVVDAVRDRRSTGGSSSGSSGGSSGGGSGSGDRSRQADQDAVDAVKRQRSTTPGGTSGSTGGSGFEDSAQADRDAVGQLKRQRSAGSTGSDSDFEDAAASDREIVNAVKGHDPTRRPDRYYDDVNEQAEQQNINAAFERVSDRFRQSRQGVETRDGTVGAAASQLEQQYLANLRDQLGGQAGGLDASMVAVRRDGDQLVAELTDRGREELGLNPTEQEVRERIAGDTDWSTDDLNVERSGEGYSFNIGVKYEAKRERAAKQFVSANPRFDEEDLVFTPSGSGVTVRPSQDAIKREAAENFTDQYPDFNESDLVFTTGPNGQVRVRPTQDAIQREAADDFLAQNPQFERDELTFETGANGRVTVRPTEDAVQDARGPAGEGGATVGIPFTDISLTQQDLGDSPVRIPDSVFGVDVPDQVAGVDVGGARLEDTLNQSKQGVENFIGTGTQVLGPGIEAGYAFSQFKDDPYGTLTGTTAKGQLAQVQTRLLFERAAEADSAKEFFEDESRSGLVEQQGEQFLGGTADLINMPADAITTGKEVTETAAYGAGLTPDAEDGFGDRAGDVAGQIGFIGAAMGKSAVENPSRLAGSAIFTGPVAAKVSPVRYGKATVPGTRAGKASRLASRLRRADADASPGDVTYRGIVFDNPLSETSARPLVGATGKTPTAGTPDINIRGGAEGFRPGGKLETTITRRNIRRELGDRAGDVYRAESELARFSRTAGTGKRSVRPVRDVVKQAEDVPTDAAGAISKYLEETDTDLFGSAAQATQLRKTRRPGDLDIAADDVSKARDDLAGILREESDTPIRVKSNQIVNAETGEHIFDIKPKDKYRGRMSQARKGLDPEMREGVEVQSAGDQLRRKLTDASLFKFEETPGRFDDGDFRAGAIFDDAGDTGLQQRVGPKAYRSKDVVDFDDIGAQLIADERAATTRFNLLRRRRASRAENALDTLREEFDVEGARRNLNREYLDEPEGVPAPGIRGSASSLKRSLLGDTRAQTTPGSVLGSSSRRSSSRLGGYDAGSSGLPGGLAIGAGLGSTIGGAEGSTASPVSGAESQSGVAASDLESEFGYSPASSAMSSAVSSAGSGSGVGSSMYGGSSAGSSVGSGSGLGSYDGGYGDEYDGSYGGYYGDYEAGAGDADGFGAALGFSPSTSRPRMEAEEQERDDESFGDVFDASRDRTFETGIKDAEDFADTFK